MRDGRQRLVRRERLGGDDRTLDLEAAEALVVVRHRRGRGGELEVDDEQLGLELRLSGRARCRRRRRRSSRRRRPARPARRPGSRTPARIRPRSPGGRTSSRRTSSLSASYGEPLGTTSSAGVGSLGGGGGAVAPEVLADREGDVDAADLHDVDRVAGDEVADLVADAVVPEVVLGLAGDDLAAVHDGDVVVGRVLGDAELLGDVAAPGRGSRPSRRGRRSPRPRGVRQGLERPRGMPR